MVASLLDQVSYPNGSRLVGSPAHGPSQEWGDAAGLAHEEGKGGNRTEPRSEQSKYPLIKAQADPAVRNEAEVVAAADPEVRGFDATTSHEVPQLRDATQRTFDNADGTQTTEFSQEPLHYKRSDGSWAPIDNRLVPSDQGFRGAANSLGVWTAEQAGADSLVRLDLDSGHRIEFGLDGAAAVPGTVEGTTITYPAVRSASDLALEVTSTGLKERMILRSPRAPRTWLFPLRLNGLTASVVGGEVVFRDKKDTVRARIPRGFMVDSAYNEHVGEYATSHGVTYELVAHQGGTAVRVTLDATWLDDPARQYPVTVDPPVDVRTAASSMYVQRNSDGANFSRTDDLKIGVARDSGGTYTAASYIAFPGVESALRNHKIFGAQLSLRNYHSWSCRARPMSVHAVTQAWTAGNSHTFPGPTHGAALTSDSFAYGHIPSGTTTSPCPTATRVTNLGVAGRDLVQRWVNDQQANHGFTLRASTDDVDAWKRFAPAGTANPPRLSITHTPFNATYKFVNPVPNPPVTRTQGGKVRLRITNLGASTWTTDGFRLAYRYFDSKGAYKGWAEAATLPHTVARGGSVTVDGLIKPTPPGTYRFEFTMMRRGGPVFTDEQIPPAVLVLRVVDVPPAIKAQYPPNGYSTPSLTPTLWAKAVDIDAPPNASLQYRFEICEQAPNPANPPINCFDSGRQAKPTWTVPVGRLQWSKTYRWRVFAFDGTSENPALPFSTMFTNVPQPEITAHLGDASNGGQSGEFDPQVGNYTASAVDATVSTIGPRLSVVRTYNSLDPRRFAAFGAGWSSHWDMRITPDDDGTGNVVLTYPDGRQARFGATRDSTGQVTGGALVPPVGRFATLIPRTTAEGGGWTLTDKSGSLYVFRPDGRPAEVYDNAGRSIAFTYGADDKLAKVTNRTSGRALHITWSGSHVGTVRTDPVDGQQLTWNYTYDGDRLTSVCDPNDDCTRYEYTSGSHYRSTIVDSKPDAYWRFGETEGTDAHSQIGLNLGADKATYSDVALGAAGVVDGVEDTAASFNGTTSAVVLPNGLVKKSRELSVELWFRTTAGGALLGAEANPLGTPQSNAVPVLYVGADGKLRGQFWNGQANPITSEVAVNDDTWHHVVLTSGLTQQTLYLDGEFAGSLAGGADHSAHTFTQVGAAHTETVASWPQWGSAKTRVFSGRIDEVAVYQYRLGRSSVWTHFLARAAADQLSKTVLPSGKTASAMTYDVDRDRLAEYTDRNGGTWTLAAPTVTGDTDNLIRTVRVNDPAGRAHFYEYDPIRGRILRYLSPLGTSTRPEDEPPPDTTVPTPDPECPPPPGEPPFCEVPIGGGPGSFPPVNFQGARTFAYDDANSTSTITDERGNQVTLSHDKRGNVLARTTCRRELLDCQSEHFEYSPSGTDPTDPRLDKVTASRDGRSTGPTDNRYLTRYTYTPGGDLETQTTPDGAVVRHTYTTDSTPAHGGGNTPAGLVLTSTDPRQAVTRYAYFANGDLAQITTPTGLVTRFAYDTLGRRTSTTQITADHPTGVTTTVAYDKLSRPTVQTAPQTTNEVTGQTSTLRTTTTYDPDGNPTSMKAVDLSGHSETRTATMVYDDHNRVVRVTDAEGNETSYGYDHFGNHTSMIDASGVQYDYAYTARNKIAEVRLRGWNGDPDGVELENDYLVLASYSYDIDGHLASSTDAMGRTLRFTYYNDGLPFATYAEGIKDADGNPRQLTLSTKVYDGAGNLTRETTSGGRITDYEYDAVGRRTATIADPAGLARRTQLSYDPAGNVTQVRMTGLESNTGAPGDPAVAEVVDYGYDPAGRQTSETVHTGTEDLTTTFGYDQRNLLTSVTDPRGNGFTTTIEYDELGRPVRSTAPSVVVDTGSTPVTAQPETVVGYDAFGNVTHTTDANDNTWRSAYDRLGRLVTTTSPDYTPPGTSEPITANTRLTYDELGRVTESASPRGAVTRYSYDQLGRLVRQTDPHPDNPGQPGGVWDYTYTRTGELLSATDPLGARTEYTYDQLARLATVSQLERHPTPGTYTSTYTYDDASNLLTAAASSGATMTFTYDALDQLTKVTDPSGVDTQLGYDRSGRQARAADEAGRTQRAAYDLAGRLTSVNDHGPAGALLRSSQFGYDPAGNLTTATDPRQKVTRYTYNALNQLTQQVEPVSDTESITTSFGYDAAGNRTRFTDGRGNTTRYTTNSWGLPESTIEPATTAHPAAADRTWTTSYDTDANPVTLTAPGGVRNTRTVDLLGQLTRETGTGAEAPTTERVYDHDPLGRLVTSGAPGGPNTFTYNDRGALLTTSGPSGNTSYGYDQDGNLTSRADASGTATYGYTNARLSTIQDGITGITQTYTYDESGLPATIDYGISGGLQREFTYDNLARLTMDELTDWETTDALSRSAGYASATVVYDYDKKDRLVSKGVLDHAGAAYNTYRYDDADRLTKWTNQPLDVDDAPERTTLYSWDAAGNRTSVDGVQSTFDERNRLTEDGSGSYTYTPRGTLASAPGGGNYAFDAFDRLANQGLTQYAYDALDRVTSRNGQQFSYTGGSNELASDGTTTFSRGPAGELQALRNGAESRMTLADQHGDVIAGFDPTAYDITMNDTAEFDPFGERIDSSGTERPIGYQGDYTDPDTDDVNMTARWYNPTTGTFTSRDNVTLAPSPSGMANRYSYGLGSPTNYTDPTGHWPGDEWACYWVGEKLICPNAGGEAGSALPPLPPPPPSSGCGGGNPLPPEARTMDCCTGILAYNSCGAGSHNGSKGGWAGSGGGAFTTGRGGGGASAPRPDPAIAARAANRSAAFNNPAPIPNAMLTPMYGGSIAPPVSAAPDLPSHHTSTYRDPINDVNKSYQHLQESLTTDTQTLLGQVKYTTAAPSEIIQANNPSGRDVEELLERAQRNAQKCEPFKEQDPNLYQKCLQLTTSSNFDAQMQAQMDLVVVESIAPIGESAWSIVEGLNPLADVRACLEGDPDACAWVAVGFVPIGRLGRAFKAVDDVPGSAGTVKRGAQACKAGGKSFTGETHVLMADGTTKPIMNIDVGDQVEATDPQTGESGPRTVTAVWQHPDTVLDLVTEDGATVTTTEDHLYWNATDNQWQQAKHLDSGDQLLTANGQPLRVKGLRLAAAHTAAAYNLTVDDIHTYYVLVGKSSVLVHNDDGSWCGVDAGKAQEIIQKAKRHGSGLKGDAGHLAADFVVGDIGKKV